ncbi:MurR/RpiR family transcriptional regulator [Cupriavidus sp. UGS-1]|uniref:MurR/RpiR family transcriptional regulator n=1 Tax=Cupriavidus sp. UGS-1 TaxID=2899826 RepID=UPI001E548788|nr:MurR/RpiR family transcriptional regulator [Cupriavidus sp. UGS-1]MCD9122473.1 MurR/RpiR family transcriptional regulator [Cupriavidus sp. UGS-1]
MTASRPDPAARPADSPPDPAPETTVSQRIAKVFPSLTPAHQRMADYVLANPFRAATMRIDEFAQAVQVSVATANRFAHALGFDGYPQFRAEPVRGFEATLAPVEKLRTELERPATITEIIAASLEENERNLQATRRALDADACERAVTAILEAEHVYVLGFGASGYLAGLLQHGLDMYCRTVITVAGVGGASTAARQLFKLTSRDLVIPIAFPRYVYDSVALTERARAHGARILALTDGPTSPLAPFADIALYVSAGRQLSANSDAAVLAMIEALCGAVAHRATGSVKAAADMTEFVLPWLHQTHARADAGRTAAAGDPQSRPRPGSGKAPRRRRPDTDND